MSTDVTPIPPLSMEEKFGVVVRESTIPEAGRGLFTTRNFSKGETICFYTGRQLTKSKLDHEYGDGVADFVVQVSENRYIDAVEAYTCPARYINGLFSNDPLINCRFLDTRCKDMDTRIAIRTTQWVPTGTELFVYYGGGYILPSFTHPYAVPATTTVAVDGGGTDVNVVMRSDVPKHSEEGRTQRPAKRRRVAAKKN